MTIAVALIAPVRAYREALASAIDAVPGIDLVCQAAGSVEALGRIPPLQPSVVLLDLGADDSVTWISGLRTAAPSTRLVAIGVGSSPAQSSAVISAAELGVAGFVDGDRPLADIVDAVRQVARGQSACSPRIVGLLLQALQRGPASRESARTVPAVPAARSTTPLTPRERLVAELASHGLTNRQIASQLSLGESTVKTHMHAILGKLGLHSRDQLVVVPHSRTSSD